MAETTAKRPVICGSCPKQILRLHLASKCKCGTYFCSSFASKCTSNTPGVFKCCQDRSRASTSGTTLRHSSSESSETKACEKLPPEPIDVHEDDAAQSSSFPSSMGQTEKGVFHHDHRLGIQLEPEEPTFLRMRMASLLLLPTQLSHHYL